jgi:heat shock protein HslJ
MWLDSASDAKSSAAPVPAQAIPRTCRSGIARTVSHPARQTSLVFVPFHRAVPLTLRSTARASSSSPALVSAAASVLLLVGSGNTQTDPLEGTTWRVITVAGQPVQESPGAPYLALDANSRRASGFTGCNDFAARYRLDGRRLTFDRITHTRKGCVDRAMTKIEAAFLDALPGVRSWRIQAMTLTLRNAAGRPLMSLQRRAKEQA